MENPFRTNKVLPIVTTDQGDSPSLPVLPGKLYVLPNNLPHTYYNIGIGPIDVSNNGLTGNLANVLRIQNNHTQVLSYICKVLFEGIIEPQKAKDENPTKPPIEINYQAQIEELKIELQAIKQALEISNKKLDELSQKF